MLLIRTVGSSATRNSSSLRLPGPKSRKEASGKILFSVNSRMETERVASSVKSAEILSAKAGAAAKRASASKAHPCLCFKEFFMVLTQPIAPDKSRILSPVGDSVCSILHTTRRLEVAPVISKHLPRQEMPYGKIRRSRQLSVYRGWRRVVSRRSL